MIKINVGGKVFETTNDTINKCSAIEVSDEIFLDHDPKVFRKTLNILRGYPCDKAMMYNSDLLHQLITLGHALTKVKLPPWIDECCRELQDHFHILDPDQLKLYSSTHILITTDAVTKMVNMGLIESDIFDECRIIGAKDAWSEACKWVPKKKYELVKNRFRFLIHFQLNL